MNFIKIEDNELKKIETHKLNNKNSFEKKLL